MKIAVSGTHNTGKSTLIGELSDLLPGIETYDEPYWQLIEEGHLFSDPPTLEGYELQLRRSIENIRQSEGDCLFERCPLDFIAYLVANGEVAEGDLEEYLPPVREAVRELDLIVFVPVETPNRISGSRSDYPRLRRRVDKALREIVLEDSLEFGRPTIEVSGPTAERVRQVMERVRSLEEN